jgi:lysophospholipase L1-like esterase
MLATSLLGAPALSAEPAPALPLRVLLVGDSTTATGGGYGDSLCRRFKPPVECLNLGFNGRSSGSYRAEGLWPSVLERVREGGPGTLVLIQFGHNDQPGKPGRSTDLATEYPANLTRYVVEAKALGAQPVLVTPLTRRSFRDGVLNNDLRPWADAARAVAAAQQVPLLDLNAASAAAVQAMGQTEADTLAEAPPGKPRFDRTHIGPKGACLFAGMVAQALPALLPSLAGALRPDPDCY